MSQAHSKQKTLCTLHINMQLGLQRSVPSSACRDLVVTTNWRYKDEQHICPLMIFSHTEFDPFLLKHEESRNKTSFVLVIVTPGGSFLNVRLYIYKKSVTIYNWSIIF